MTQRPLTTVGSGSSEQVSISLSGTSSSDSQIVRGTGYHRPTRSSKDIEGAVYAYIRAVRALGQTSVNSVDISRALSLPLGEVEQAIQGLRDKGVRIIKCGQETFLYPLSCLAVRNGARSLPWLILTRSSALR